MRFACLLVTIAAAFAADWPQFGGPNRDFSVPAAVLADRWPANGPPQLWRRPLGDGYSGIAAVQGVLYTLYRRGEDDIVIALDAATGKTNWEHAESRRTSRSLDLQYGSGPHSTPLVRDGVVFAVTLTAKVLALDAATGKLLWRRDLWDPALNAPGLSRGYAASPVAWKDTLLLPVGGRGQALIALRRKDGSIAWKSGNFDPTYSAPFIATLHRQPQVLTFFGRHAAAMNPDTGEVLWSHEHRTDYDLNVSAPVAGSDNVVFLSSAYSGGSRAIRIHEKAGRFSTEELWFHRRMRLHHGNALRMGNLVFGASGDFGPTPMVCVNVQTGAILWQDRALKKANMLSLGGGKVLALDEDGHIVLATLSQKGIEVHARAQILQSNAWTAPSLAGGIVYARDRREIVAVDLRPRGE